MKVKELIKMTPFTSEDGLFFQSFKDMKSFEFDFHKGEILHDYTLLGPRSKDVEDAESFVINRVDHWITAINVDTGLPEVNVGAYITSPNTCANNINKTSYLNLPYFIPLIYLYHTPPQFNFTLSDISPSLSFGEKIDPTPDMDYSMVIASTPQGDLFLQNTSGITSFI